ncbi:MAG: response regulator transcription factor [Rhizobiales bacterium]|nr:response regulator transcription factor [Hyphomicrobiales bacterium]
MTPENSKTAPVIDVALADSNPLMLSALSEFFDRDPRFSLVATASTAEGFLEAVLRVPVTAGVVDWTLPMLGTEKLLEVLRAQSQPPRIIVYSHNDGGDVPRHAMAAGAAGFCARSEAPAKLLDIVADVAAGQMVFPFLDVRELNKDPRHTLTKRERALLEALATGQTNKELAGQFGITVNTVKFHLRNLFDKLSVRNRAQAIAFYYSSNIAGVAPPDGSDGDI